MSIYKGMALEKNASGEDVTWIYAQHLPETDAWAGAGNLGMMPDLKTAKAYVDWLHEVGPDTARASVMTGEVRHGYVAFVHGGEPDSHGNLLEHLSTVAGLIEAGVSDAAVAKRARSLLLHAIHHLEIAADQKGAARASGSFFVTGPTGSGTNLTEVHLGNFGLPGDWNGSGRVALGVGEGWIGPVTDQLAQDPIRKYRGKHLVPTQAPDGYGRMVFVDGPEPALSRADIEVLKLHVGNLVTVNGYPTRMDEDRKRYTLLAATAVRQVAEAALSAINAEDAECTAPQPN